MGQRSSAVECVQSVTLPAKRSGKWEPPNVTLSQKPHTNQTSSISGDTKVQLIYQAQQSKGTRQFLTSQKCTQNQIKMLVQIANPLRECKKQESKVEFISDIPKAAQQTSSASEMTEQINPERDRDEDKTSKSTKHTLALTSDPRVCDASRLSQEEQICLLQEAARARALVVTMVYQDGTTLLDPEQVG